MKLLLSLLATVTIATALKTFPKVSNVKDFADFVAQTGKIYNSIEERNQREKNFIGHKNMIDASMKLTNSTYSLTINALADMEPDEVRQMMGRLRFPNGEKSLTANRKTIDAANFNGIPSSFDWRKEGGVTPVKFQGYECGACWAFVTTGAIEGHWYGKTGELVPLSEQHLIDCSTDFGNTGCDGGFQDYAFEYVTQNRGIAKESLYPFLQEQKECKYNDSQRGVTVIGYSDIENEEIMKNIVATLGPVACSINAREETFTFYSSGLYTDDECNTYDDFNHSILVVGYGREDGKDYWLVKNSWSANWGDGGYMKMPRNSNYCGIGKECSFPII